MSGSGNIIIKRFRSLKRALDFLEFLASKEDFIFRGHKDSDYKLETTLKRQNPFLMLSPGKYIKEFKTRLARHGLLPSFCKTPLDWMEYARHCGIPSPVIDFTYSPYVALFFAFNGIRPKKRKYVSIYAVNTKKLAHAWAYQEASRSYDINQETQQWKECYDLMYYNFLGWNEDFISSFTRVGEDFFLMNVLQIIPHPSKFNRRMLIQQGLFLYDTLCNSYSTGIKWIDLEDWITQANNPDKEPIIYKILLPKKLEIIKEALSRLDMMNITAGALFETPDAIAEDIRNVEFYNPKLGIR
jgi:hypothetical protein